MGAVICAVTELAVQFLRIQPPIQWVRGAVSLGVKRRGCEADHSPPYSAEVYNEWRYASTPPIRLPGA